MINTVWLILLTAITVINIIAHFAMKINDLKHLECDIKKIGIKINSLDEEIKKQGERLSQIEGYLKGRKNGYDVS